jgi:hypothetical protein
VIKLQRGLEEEGGRWRTFLSIHTFERLCNSIEPVLT